MRVTYPGKIDKLRRELADAEEAVKTAAPARAAGISARMAALRRRIRWYESRCEDSPSPVPGLDATRPTGCTA